jgi:hypothetical protein
MLENRSVAIRDSCNFESRVEEFFMKMLVSSVLAAFSFAGMASDFDLQQCLNSEMEKLGKVSGMSQAGKMYQAEANCKAQKKQALIPNLIRGFANDIVCGEIDPYAVGDACIVYTTDRTTGKRLGLVYNDYDFATIHIPEPDSIDDWIDEEFEASTCELIEDPNKISELKELDPSYIYIHCYVYDFNWYYMPIDEL